MGIRLRVKQLAKQVAAESRVSVSFKKIPREVLEKKAVEQGDVSFSNSERCLSMQADRQEIILKLKDFLIPTDDIQKKRERRSNIGAN